MAQLPRRRPRSWAFCRCLQRFCLVSIAAQLLSCQNNGMFALAKKDDTASPTTTPGPSPLPSYSPSSSPSTSFPTSSPTESPTSSPTYGPTTAPSFFPSEVPSFFPSEEPSTSPTITASPTEEIVPTLRPSSMPSSRPSLTPPTAEPEIRVALPRMAIEFNLNDNESSGTFFKRLEDELVMFIENVLDRNGSVQDFESVELVFQIIQEVLRGRRSRTRRLATFVRVEIEGSAIFDTPTTTSDTGSKSPPTTEDLEKILRAYFSFWGTDDLQNHLHSFGLGSADELRVFLDDEPVEVLTELEGGPGEGGNGGEGTPEDSSPGQGSKDKDRGGPKIRTGILIALVAAAVFIPFAVALVIFQGKKLSGRGRRQRREAPSTSGSTGRIGARPKSTPSKTPSVGTSNQAENVVQDFDDGISIDNSLYTTDNTIISPPNRVTPSPAKYDAKRLDKVIAAAKQHSSDQSVKS